MVCRSQAILFLMIRMTQKKQSLLVASEATFVKGGSQVAQGTELRLLSAPGWPCRPSACPHVKASVLGRLHPGSASSPVLFPALCHPTLTASTLGAQPRDLLDGWPLSQ